MMHGDTSAPFPPAVPAHDSTTFQRDDSMALVANTLAGIRTREQPSSPRITETTTNNEPHFVGVYMEKMGWASQIRVRGSKIYLGSYATRHEAALAYDFAVKSFNLDRPLNFPHGPTQAGLGNSPPQRTHGVFLEDNSWVARIWISGSIKHIGTFGTRDEAARAYDAYVVSNSLSRPLNFPSTPVLQHSQPPQPPPASPHLPPIVDMERPRTQRNANPASKYLGVSPASTPNKWGVEIKLPLSKKKYLGAYDDEEVAARVYDTAAKKYHGKYAILNFPTTEDLNMGRKWALEGGQKPRPETLSRKSVKRSADGGGMGETLTSAAATAAMKRTRRNVIEQNVENDDGRTTSTTMHGNGLTGDNADTHSV